MNFLGCKSEEIELNNIKFSHVKISENKEITFTSSNIPLNISFVLFEFHTKHDEFIISRNKINKLVILQSHLMLEY